MTWSYIHLDVCSFDVIVVTLKLKPRSHGASFIFM